ncbi:MAG: enolase C-terminal domain-like protein, partial [Janthinobacterium lividum]
LRRLDLLRAQHGDAVTLSVDANGQWSPQNTPARLRALATRGVEYVEQPIAAGDWQALDRLLEDAPLIVMLDESLQSGADIARLCALAGAPVAAHLKLVKLGGIAATIDAARRLQAVGIPLMIGQMNEGAAATAAALHVCCATAPRWAELYGADGLRDDPVSGLSYGAGTVRVDDPRGLGVAFSSAPTQTLSL